MFSFLMIDFRLTAGRRVLETTVKVDPGGNVDPRESSFVAVVDGFRHNEFLGMTTRCRHRYATEVAELQP